MPYNTENPVLGEVRTDFELFYADPATYQRKVDGVSDLFGLTGAARLRNDYLPTYVVGDLEDEQYKYAVFSLNPGFTEEKNRREENLRNGSWERYLRYMQNYFSLCYESRCGWYGSRYYNYLGKLLGALENTSLEWQEQRLRFFQEHLINLDLIPYHSPETSFSVSNSTQKDYLLNRLNAGIELLKTQNIRLALFNGKPMYSLMYSLLIEQGIVKPWKCFPINDKVSLYAFEFEGMPCVLFDRLISQSFFKITNVHLTETIPDIIRKLSRERTK